MGFDLIPKASIEELVRCADLAKAKYAEARACLLEARGLHAKACVGGRASSDSKILDYELGRSERGERFDEAVTDMINRDLWRSLIVNTPMFSLMDLDERKKFDKSLEGKPPAVTVEAIWLNVQRLIDD